MTAIDHKSMCTQRFILSVLTFLLGPCSFLFGLIGDGYNPTDWYKSISATYYATSNVLMIGFLTAVSIFFFAYKGYDIRDRICSLIEAICCIGIVLFPCNSLFILPYTIGIFQLPGKISNIFHCTFAAVLFLTFGFNLIFLFTLGKDEKTNKKKIRDIIYRTCGIVIWVMCVFQAITTSVWKWYPEWYPNTLINEIVMLTAFAFAYLVKSEGIAKFNDEPNTKL